MKARLGTGSVISGILAAIVLSGALAGCANRSAQLAQQREESQAAYRAEKQKKEAEKAERVSFARANQIKITKDMQAAFEQAVGTELKDPDSAKFKHVWA